MPQERQQVGSVVGGSPGVCVGGGVGVWACVGVNYFLQLEILSCPFSQIT